MEQVTLLSQHEKDKTKFIDIFSKFTGISKMKLGEYLEKNTINNIFEHPYSLEINSAQVAKINQLRELKSLYSNLYTNDHEYVINSSSRAGEYFLKLLENKKDKEVFVAAFLNTANAVISTEIISSGTNNEAPIYPRELIKLALNYDANSVMISHNHPGGTLSPSSADLSVTTKIAQALQTLNIKLIDHIIVAGDKYYSFAEKGLSNNLAPVIKEAQGEYKIKNEIVELYKDEYPGIKHISENTAEKIKMLNSEHGINLSIKDIKDRFYEIGKKYEISQQPSDFNTFNTLKSIVDGLRKSQLDERTCSKTYTVNNKSMNLEL